MVENKGDSNVQNPEEFNLRNELSTLVAQRVIHPKIAQKLEQRLTEKNVKINKKQLHALAYKIRDAMNAYTKTRPQPAGQPGKATTPGPAWKQPDANMQKLIESIEELKDRITNIEQNKIKGSRVRTVTTRDIKTPGKNDEPKQEEELNPLLDIPNDPESVVILMKWLQYLVDKIGKNNLPDVLGYYVDIGWISEDVRLDLINYSKGIIEEKKETGTHKTSPNLSARDHLQSLLYIQKLKGLHLDDRFVCKIEREMEKMTKSLDNYQFK